MAGSTNNFVTIPANPANTVYYADLDSGSGTISLPSASYTALFQAIGFRFDNAQNVYVGACNSFPDLSFTLSDGSSMFSTTKQFYLPGSYVQVAHDPMYAATNECRALIREDTSCKSLMTHLRNNIIHYQISWRYVDSRHAFP